MLFYALMLLAYVLCMFLNPVLCAMIDKYYRVETPVAFVSFLGFFGTFILSIVFVMSYNRDEYATDIFNRIYRHIKDGL